MGSKEYEFSPAKKLRPLLDSAIVVKLPLEKLKVVFLGWIVGGLVMFRDLMAVGDIREIGMLGLQACAWK